MKHHPDDARHIAACDDCQARASLNHAALDVDLDRAWIGVAAEAWASPISPLERAATRLLGSPGLARALVNTPALFLSWILASIAVLAAGVVATFAVEDLFFALVAPALAGAGVAFAYGPGLRTVADHRDLYPHRPSGARACRLRAQRRSRPRRLALHRFSCQHNSGLARPDDHRLRARARRRSPARPMPGCWSRCVPGQ